MPGNLDGREVRTMKRCDCGCMELGKDPKAAQERETPEPRGERKAKGEGRKRELATAGGR